ncbi:Golgin subfamily A member 3 [Rhizoctonia solani]|uniref:Golgin subfamily A member 3 n=1 Tax=Rhizoctonia solani TaxID=456999 RepID=A0A0K6G599_9AGAM|nr:Golgin subfamily A member 3 [Rhizoctonia solani]
MARHRATRPSVASVVSTTSTNGTRSRSKLSYEQSTLLALAENSLKKQKKPLNVSAIVKDAERRAHEQGLSLGIQARTRIKKAVGKLSEDGAIAEAPRQGRAPARYSLTPRAVKLFNDAKSHRRSDIGIAKEVSETLKGDTGGDRPAKRRRSSVSMGVTSSHRSTQQQAAIEKLKADLAVARSEIKTLKQSNQDLLDQQLDDDDDYDAFGSPTRKALSSQRLGVDSLTRPHSGTRGLSFNASRPTRPTTPEPTEHGSPEYEAPDDIDYPIGMEMEREVTPPSSSPPDAIVPSFAPEHQTVREKSETELKLEQLEASMAELTLEKTRMAEEIVALQNQVRHERETVVRLTQEKHEIDLVRVELTQVSKERDSAYRDVTRLGQEKAELEARCTSMKLAEQEMEDLVSKAEAEAKTQADIRSQLRTQLASITRELEESNASLVASQDEARRLAESLAVAEATIAVLNENLLARESTVAELQSTQSLNIEQLQTLRSEIQALRNTLSVAEDRITATEAIATERGLQIGGLQADQEAMRATVTGLRTQKAELANENSSLLAQINGLNALAADLRAQIESVSSKAQGLEVLVSELQSSLNTVRLEKDQEETKFEVEYSNLSRRIAERDAIIAEANRTTKKLQDDLMACNNQLSGRESEIVQLRSTLVESTTEVESLKKARDDISSKLSSSTEEARSLKQRLGELRRKDEANTKQIGQLEASLVLHRNSIEEHQDAMSKLELQLDRLRNIELESLRRRRARVEAEAKRLRDEEAELTQEAIDVDQWDESLTQSRAERSSLAPNFPIPSSP